MLSWMSLRLFDPLQDDIQVEIPVQIRLDNIRGITAPGDMDGILPGLNIGNNAKTCWISLTGIEQGGGKVILQQNEWPGLILHQTGKPDMKFSLYRIPKIINGGGMNSRSQG